MIYCWFEETVVMLRDVLEIQIFDLGIIKPYTSRLQKNTIYFAGSFGHRIYLKKRKQERRRNFVKDYHITRHPALFESS